MAARTTSLGGAALAAALALTPAAHAAPVAGFGAAPSVSGLATTAAGTTVLVGTSGSGAARRPIIAFGAGGELPSQATPLGRAAATVTSPRLALDDAGAAAVTWSIGRTVFFRRCTADGCGATVTVGRSGDLPDAQVAVDPRSGRATVLWSGRTPSGRDRLQWRITTGGRFGRVHTLAERGDQVRLATDASGKTVAVWTMSVGVRTAARRVGEFTRPATLKTGPSGALQLVVDDAGTFTAAWRGSGDGEEPGGTAFTASRTADGAFGAPQPVPGLERTHPLVLAAGPQGRAALATTDAQAGSAAAVQLSERPTAAGPFGPPQAVSPARAVVSSVAAAVDAQGRTTVAYGSRDGTFVADAPPAAAAVVDPAPDAAVALAAAGDRTVLARVTAGGVDVTRVR